MDHPKERSEFGLDKDNALDVQKERAKSTIPWVIGGVVALLAAFALMMFFLPNAPNNNASHVPSASTTSESGTLR
jgi:uncharacterized membrane protein